MAKFFLKAKSGSGAFEFQASGESDKDLFKSVARFLSVYDNDKCEACQSSNVKPVYAVRGGNEFFEMTCIDCGCRLQFTSTAQDPATLFPRRRVYKRDGVKLDTPEEIPNNGWVRYERPQQQTQQPTQQPVQPTAPPVDDDDIPF